MDVDVSKDMNAVVPCYSCYRGVPCILFPSFRSSCCHGNVAHCYRNGQGKGYGFITFNTMDEAPLDLHHSTADCQPASLGEESDRGAGLSGDGQVKMPAKSS